VVANLNSAAVLQRKFNPSGGYQYLQHQPSAIHAFAINYQASVCDATKAPFATDFCGSNPAMPRSSSLQVCRRIDGNGY
jgi:hypothetical protein